MSSDNQSLTLDGEQLDYAYYIVHTCVEYILLHEVLHQVEAQSYTQRRVRTLSSPAYIGVKAAENTHPNDPIDTSHLQIERTSSLICNNCRLCSYCKTD